MKLISCYIEGYGKIKQKEIKFDEGITPIFWENGEGKSTLASFLKAMLYGLEGYAKNSKAFCDREHFYPFDGGRFGGNLQLDIEGKVYKIERFFAEKSETGDSLTVYEEGEAMPSPPVDIGRVLLKMDKESFERTAFLRHDDLEMDATSGIHARLNRFLEGGEEDGGLDEALLRLDKAAKVYKKRGGGDKITEEKENIDRIKVKIENAAGVKGALDKKYECLEGLQAQIKESQEHIATAQSRREVDSQFEHYDSLIEGVERAEKEAGLLLQKYPQGVPSIEETRAFNEYMVAANEWQIKMEGTSLTPQEEEKLRSLEARFSGGTPTAEALAEIEQKIDEYKALDGTGTARAKTAREEELIAKFARSKPSKEELDGAEVALRAYKEKKRAQEDATAFAQTGGKVAAKRYAVFAVLFAAVLLTGVVLVLLKQPLVGGLLAALGGGATLVDGFLYLNKKTAGQVPAASPERLRLEEERLRLERSLQALLLPYGYREESVELAFDRLQRDLSDFEDLLAAQRAEEARLQERAAQREALQTALSAFFARYGGEGESYLAKISSLKVALSDFAALLRRSAEGKAVCDEAEKERAALVKKARAYQEKYSLLTVDTEEIFKDVRSLERAFKEVEEGRKRAEAFKREKGLSERTEAPVEDVEDLRKACTRLQEEYSKLDREITEDERTAEELDSLQEEKKQAEERLKEYRRKYDLLTNTATLLKAAAGRLRDKYVKPVKDEFLKYATVIERALGEKVVMTKDFKLRFERGGVERSEKHLSSGQRSICALCFRLALLANMYEGQRPFLVLDDPFVTLDEGHLLRVKEVLRALSKDMQMVYMTCHASRKIQE